VVSFVWPLPFACGSPRVSHDVSQHFNEIARPLSGSLQYLFYILFYQRFVEDRVLNFIDLCSLSNISVFILLYNQYGYYVHGRSPHGATDVNMRDMIGNLDRESKQMSGTRGLQTKSDDQLFIMRIERSFRIQYETLLQSYRVR
jgi:meckelin